MNLYKYFELFPVPNEDPLDTCHNLLLHGYIHCVNSKHETLPVKFEKKQYYQCTTDKSKYILNNRRINIEHTTATETAVNLHNFCLALASKYIYEDGFQVDYRGIAMNRDYVLLQEKVTFLQNLNLRKLSNDERKAFFINIYNVLVIHATIANGKPKNALQRRAFFNKTAYTIGNNIYTLQIIEHGILRGNSKPPGSFNKILSKKNPIYQFKIEIDARIHFALVCGARSCPPIRVFSHQNIEYALDLATKNFIQSDAQINYKLKKVKVSRLFQWYAIDFKKCSETGKIVDYIALYLDDPGFEDFIQNNRVKIKYSNYSWDSNGRGYQEDLDILSELDSTVLSEKSTTTEEVSNNSTSSSISSVSHLFSSDSV
eukprot:TRINITY_DN8947_c0_g1_i1.p1 TRINITY_DN8947_c0_g1~~TRINITY_DN8947_c0_g1_i1.p1  ORF type:complete len:372 (-),score=78.85 TRINITY_DN8947_c0_g1_i1:32-1147(-)